MLPGCSRQSCGQRRQLRPCLGASCSLLRKHHCRRKSQVWQEHCAAEIPRSYLTQLAVINIMLKLRQAAVLCRNLSPSWKTQRWLGVLVSAPLGRSCASCAGSIPCRCGHCCSLLRWTPLPAGPCSASPRGEQFVSYNCSCPQPQGILTRWPFFATDKNMYKLPLPIPHRNQEEFLREYQLSYRISTMFLQRHQLFLYFYKYMHAFAGILVQK